MNTARWRYGRGDAKTLPIR